MKKHLISRIFNAFMLFAVLQLCITCNKDNESDEDNYRLDSFIEQMIGDFRLDCYILYEGDRVHAINYFYSDDDGNDTVQELYDYPLENVITRTKSNKEAGIYVPTWKEEMVFQNGVRTQSISSSYNTGFQTWDESYKVDYVYYNGNLVEESSSNYSSNQWIPVGRNTYEYVDDRLSKITKYDFYNDWELSSVEVVHYNGDLFSHSIRSFYHDGSFTDSTRFDYIFQGELLSSIEIYNYGTHEEQLPFTFLYDSKGLLVTEHFEAGNELYQKDYTYEKGNGNFEQLKDPGGGFALYMVYPYPTK
jgi:hypothetical protein